MFSFEKFQYRKRQALLQQVRDMLKPQINGLVSIPQAVGTVATMRTFLIKVELYLFQYRKRQALLQLLVWVAVVKNVVCFNTASGRHCCNSGVQKASIHAVPKASFGKPQTVNGKFSPHQVLEGLETQVNTGGKPFL